MLLKLLGLPVVPYNDVSLSTIVSDATTFITAAMGWIGQAVTVVMENPIILIPFFVMFAGLAWGLARRALNVMK